jgi:hypothetical protein
MPNSLKFMVHNSLYPRVCRSQIKYSDLYYDIELPIEGNKKVEIVVYFE